MFLLGKHISEGNEIRRVILIVKLYDTGIDLSMGFAVKVRSVDNLDDLVENVIIQQDGPENSLFGLEVLRGQFAGKGLVLIHERMYLGESIWFRCSRPSLCRNEWRRYHSLMRY